MPSHSLPWMLPLNQIGTLYWFMRGLFFAAASGSALMSSRQAFCLAVWSGDSLAVRVTRWMSRPSVDCPTTCAEMRSLCAISVLRNGAISSYGVTPRAIDASVGSSGTVGSSGCDG